MINSNFLALLHHDFFFSICLLKTLGMVFLIFRTLFLLLFFLSKLNE
ncbi:hypothetical protein HMP0015_0164 [Acinetobacter haemolyticus ATCC 19194]|uniref:Uncharacterized protein n=1 Tax=Acinetobacter haemolyticus ATCC 19194 TaxID=707232 RepID=D4XKC2_ACIHA|nr:hypothetical protein HMP0015_0164 [Acinetobacter haemolyticus ATCC 19194]EXE69067.1 hypothetical protein J583_4080 [Acinetobacter baumannii 83444]